MSFFARQRRAWRVRAEWDATKPVPRRCGRPAQRPSAGAHGTTR